MREIKFRVWDKKFKRFVIGYDDRNNYDELYSDPPGLLNGALNTLKGCDQYVLQQFTGLKDKNGKEIYEGDILQALATNESIKEMGVCKQVMGGWKIFSHPNSSICWGGWKQEVIGNIFENPELL